MSGSSWKGGAVAAVGATLVAVLGCTVSAAAEGWVWPVAGRVLTPYLNDNARPYAAGMHRGIDVAAPVGTAVLAAAGGHVRYAGSLGSSGLTVALRTADGRYETSYLHLSEIDVARGDEVASGEKLGEVGVTGTRSASQPHLHFGVRLAGTEHTYVDPLTLLPPVRGSERAAPGPAATRPAPVVAQPQLLPASAPRSRRVPAPVLRPRPLRAPASSWLPRSDERPATLPAAAPARAPAPGRKLSGHAVGHVPLAPRARLEPSPAVHARDRMARAPIQPHPGAGHDWGRWLALAGGLLIAAALGRRAIGTIALELARVLRAGHRRDRPQERPRAIRHEPSGRRVVSEVS